MTLFATPGIYRQTLEPAYRPGTLARGDIAVFLGYATRGPVLVPVRLQSLSQFEDVFGPRLVGGHLWDGIKGFFETGGIAAYAIRITDGTERAASADLTPPPDPATPDTVPVARWQAEASFPWRMVDPQRANPVSRADMAVWQARVDAEIREGGPRRPDPGSWGNLLELTIAPAALAVTRATELLEDGRALRLNSVAGIEPATILQFDGNRGIALSAVLPAQRLVRLATPLPAATPMPLQLRSVEFDLTIAESGRILQQFRALAPDPAHGRSIATILATESRHVALRGPGHGTDWTNPETWPPEGTYPLTGGRDGLSGTNASHWRTALAQLPRLSDAAMIVAPDLVRGDGAIAQQDPIPGLDRSCSDISPQAPGNLSGHVRDSETDQPLPGVLVDVAGVGGTALTDEDGLFELTGVTLGQVDLRVSKQGFQLQEVTAQSLAWPGIPSITIRLAPLHPLPVLNRQDVLDLQRDMGNPAIVGRWKIAFADCPLPVADPDAFRSLAAELGPEPRLGLLAPWIELPDPAADGGRRTAPASGHVAGAFARAEIEGGIFRTGANLPLRYACGVSVAIDDADQAGLNPVGVNAIRVFPGRGVRLYGTRSLAIGTEWQFLSVRRIIDAIERTLETTLAKLVFEPNSPFLRHAARAATEAFLARLWREGHLAGDSPEAAFRVTSDDGNNPPALTDNGQMLIEVAVAPVVPFEFIVFRIGHAFDALQITEVA